MNVSEITSRGLYNLSSIDDQEVDASSEANEASKSKEAKGSNQVQPSTGDRRSVKDDLTGNPQLPPPSDAFKPFETKLTLESLIELISDENKTLNSDSAKKALSVSSNERAVQNEKRIAELDTQIEKLEEQEKMSAIKKTMNKVMAFFQLLGAVCAIAIAVVCPNPVTIAGAVLATATAIDNALNVFSDGKISMSAGIEALDKACGGDGSFAKAMNLFITLHIAAAQIALSFMNPAQGLSAAANIISAVNGVSQGVAQITQGAVNMTVDINNALLQYDIQDSQSRQMMIQALLKQLDNSQERELEEVKDILKQGQELANGLEEVLESINAGLKSAATGSV